MIENKNIPFYIAGVMLIIILKLLFINADNDFLLFLIKPTKSLVEIFTNNYSVYNSSIGFYFPNINIIIDKSCSGFNLMIIAYAMTNFIALNNSQKITQRILSIPFSFTAAYIFTIIVNSSRIITSLRFDGLLNKIINDSHVSHQAIGVINNLTFLILFYILIEKYFSKKTSYEKSSQS